MQSKQTRETAEEMRRGTNRVDYRKVTAVGVMRVETYDGEPEHQHGKLLLEDGPEGEGLKIRKHG